MLRVVINPIAGGGHSLSILDQVRAELTAHGLAHEVFTSKKKGDITALVRDAVAAGDDGVVLLGGDGTLFEAVNGLPETPYPLFIVPCGTGNDFRKTLGLPADPIRALRAQLDGSEALLDICQLNGMRFINVSGTGFDIEVLRQTEKYKPRFRGLIAYLLGLIQAIFLYRPLKATFTVDGETFEKELTIIEIANGQYIGGGMRVAPMADPTDGKLDVVYVDKVSKPGICLLLPFFIPGWYTRLPITHALRADSVTLSCPGMTVNVDGDLIGMDRAEYTVLKGRIIVRQAAPIRVQPLRSEPRNTVASP